MSHDYEREYQIGEFVEAELYGPELSSGTTTVHIANLFRDHFTYAVEDGVYIIRRSDGTIIYKG